ncbi:MAG TPA: hypothetical protein VN875_17495 [Candidatus Binatus sp.]|nr:hypothetical protein [Candidatus Binatus sp.]
MRRKQRENGPQDKPVLEPERPRFDPIEELLQTYREWKFLHKKANGENKQFARLVLKSPNAKALLAMNATVRRDASLRRTVLRELTKSKTRPVLIDFVKELFPSGKSEETVSMENLRFEKKALCFTLLKFGREYGQRFPNKSLSRLVYVTPPTIRAWREQFDKFDPESETALARRIDAHLESSRGWSTWWKAWLKKTRGRV